VASSRQTSHARRGRENRPSEDGCGVIAQTPAFHVLAQIKPAAPFQDHPQGRQIRRMRTQRMVKRAFSPGGYFKMSTETDKANAQFVARAARICRGCLLKGNSCKTCPGWGAERLVEDRRIEVEGGWAGFMSVGRKNIIAAISRLCTFGFRRREISKATKESGMSRKARSEALTAFVRHGYLEISSDGGFIRFTPLGLELANDVEKQKLAARRGGEPGART